MDEDTFEFPNEKEIISGSEINPLSRIRMQRRKKLIRLAVIGKVGADGRLNPDESLA